MDILRKAISLRLKAILKELSTRSLSTKEQQEYNDIRNVMIDMGIDVPPLRITLH